MNKERAMELMNAIDPALIEQADIPMPAKRRVPKITRAVLIAACLCLALAGTAAAAVANGWIRISATNSRQINRPDGTTVSIAEVEIVADGKAYVPWENFSQQCQDFLNDFYGMPQYKGFDSWDELEEFLGLNIFDNPMLDQAKPVVHENKSSLGYRTETGSCFAGFCGFINEPDLVDLSAAYQFETHDSRYFILSLYAMLITYPREFDERTTGRIFTRAGTEPIAMTTETYVTPSGLQTVIVTTDTGNIEVYFQMNSAHFNISVYCDDAHMDEGVRTVKEVLDAFS